MNRRNNHRFLGGLDLEKRKGSYPLVVGVVDDLPIHERYDMVRGLDDVAPHGEHLHDVLSPQRVLAGTATSRKRNKINRSSERLMG